MTKELKQPKRLTVHQAKLLTIFTGYQLVPFDILHNDIQSRLGGQMISVQSYADPEFMKAVQDIYREDLIRILPQISVNELNKHSATIENEATEGVSTNE